MRHDRGLDGSRASGNRDSELGCVSTGQYRLGTEQVIEAVTVMSHAVIQQRQGPGHHNQQGPQPRAMLWLAL